MGSEQQEGEGVWATLQGLITNPRCGHQPRTRVAHEVELGAHVERLGGQKGAEAVQVSTAPVYTRGRQGGSRVCTMTHPLRCWDHCLARSCRRRARQQ